jgi:hypothetical protein
MNENTKTEMLTIEVPLDGFSPEKLENLQKLIDSKAVLIKKASARPARVFLPFSSSFQWKNPHNALCTVRAFLTTL